LGLGFEQAKQIKPDISMRRQSGYGADGPYVNRPGQDLLVQALSGLADSGRANTAARRRVSAIDHHGQRCLRGHSRCTGQEGTDGAGLPRRRQPALGGHDLQMDPSHVI